MIPAHLRLSSLPAPILAAIKTLRPGLIAVAAASLLINILMLVGPLFMLQVYDRVLPSRSVPTLVGLLVIALALLVIQGTVDALRSRLLTRMAEAYDSAMRDVVFDSVQFSALNRDSDGLQIMRDLDTVRGFIAGSGPVAFCDLPWTPLYILVCTLFHPLMGLAVAIGAVLLTLMTAAAELMTRKPTSSLVGLASSRRTTSETAYHHAEVVHAMGLQGRMAEIWSGQTETFLDAQRRVADLSGGFGSASRFLRMTLQSGVLALGAWLVINQQATAGVMLAATILSIRALAPIELAIANWRGFIAGRDSFRRMCEAIAAMPATTDITALPAPRHHLSVGSISLLAPRSDVLVLHDVSFALKAGNAVAVLGPSGTGKSTLARALVGVIKPARGVIRIDGAALSQWDQQALGCSIGFLPQDVALFRGTVADNIKRFTKDTDSTKLLAAAQQAGVHDMILRLPKGYETEVGDGGLMLSGGQRQRIALARALYGDPFLVVLDEPNSNLDGEGERALLQAIVRVRARGGIVVVIAHRPTLLSAVDHLLVLNDGRLQAFGTTESVLPLLQRPDAQPVPTKKSTQESKAKSPTIRKLQGRRWLRMSKISTSITHHMLAVGAAAGLMVLSFGILSAATSLSGAIIATGSLVVESSVKKVQHPAGGVVKTLFVTDGARVDAGDLLVQMDETVAQANLAAVTKSLWELEARRARLQAERDGDDSFAVPASITDAKDASADAIIAGEKRFFQLRLEASDGQKRQLHEQISQLTDQIGGLNDQLNAKKQESDYLIKELGGVQQLWDQRLVSLTRLTALQRDQSRLLGERGQLTASIAQARGKISETELKILQIDQDFRSGVAKELADIRAKYAEAIEKQVAARDQTDKLELRAPQSGIVHDLSVHTVGGVISPGETVMTIVPDSDSLIVEAHVTPQDIDQIRLDQSAVLRFPNFNQRTTPEIDGTVSRIGADVSRDDKTSPTYFTVRIAISTEEMKRLGNARLLPGMPVEVFIQTGDRTMLSYLTKPLADQMNRAFREK